jgi:hypothetical protein
MNITQTDLKICESFDTFKSKSVNFIDKHRRKAVSFFDRYVCCCCLFVNNKKKKAVLKILKDIDGATLDDSKLDFVDDDIQLKIQNPIDKVKEEVKEEPKQEEVKEEPKQEEVKEEHVNENSEGDEDNASSNNEWIVLKTRVKNSHP